MSTATIAEPHQPPLSSFDKVLLSLWEHKARGDVVSHEEIERATGSVSTIRKNSFRWGGLIARMKGLVLDASGHEIVSVRRVGYAKAESGEQGDKRPKAKLGRMHRAAKKAIITATLVPNHELTEKERRSRDITTACFDQQMGAVVRARQEQKMLTLSETK